MVNRIVHAFKRFALQAALRCLPVDRLAVADPEPRVRFVGPDSLFDEFLFEPVNSRVAVASGLLGAELTRVSDRMSELRQLLCDLARFEPAGTVLVNAVAGQNFRWAEDVLFDGDAFAAPARPVLSIDGDADFLFEGEPVPPSWRAPDAASVGLQHA